MNRPVHFEILGDDPAALAEFYRGVFGWEIATWEGQGYWLATTGAAGTPGIDGGTHVRCADREGNLFGIMQPSSGDAA